MDDVHIMTDIETMCFGSNSAIVEIAAVAFNIDTAEIYDEIFIPISLDSCILAGLRVNGDTILWWMQQDDSSRNRIATQETVPIQVALVRYSEFLKRFNEPYMWGRSPRFDLGIIYDAYRIVQHMQHPPWNIRKERCVRTYEGLRPEVLKSIPLNTAKHDPIADCKYQISYVTKIHQLIK